MSAQSAYIKQSYFRSNGYMRYGMDGLSCVARFTWSSWEALWYLVRCRWWGTFCCSAWTVPRPGRWETSQSSKRCHSCTRDSRGSIWDHPSGTQGHRWAEGASPSGTQTEGGRSLHSLPSSPKAEIWARSHFPAGHTSETAGFHHFCSSPVKQLKLHNMLFNKADNGIGILASNQLTIQVVHCHCYQKWTKLHW